MAQNKILQKGTNITQGETSVLIKYGCLSSLPRSDRWGGSAYFGFCCIFLNRVTQVARKQGGVCRPLELRCIGLPPAGQNCTYRRRIPPRRFNGIHSLQKVSKSLILFKASLQKEIHLKNTHTEFFFSPVSTPQRKQKFSSLKLTKQGKQCRKINKILQIKARI